ncbi:ATP-binding protein [Akkermansiaceae bacterium]|nr:ATP-binding protein [Akkermansiaceae bacterium]
MNARAPQILTLLSCLVAASALHGQSSPPLAELSITELEDHLVTIDARLEQLAHFSFQSGVGSNGNRSLAHRESKHPEWFEVQLTELQAIDQVILVPHLVRDNEAGLVSDGFPIELQIIAGTQDHPEGELITRSRPKGGKQHIAPFIFPTPGLKASWIRIEATELSVRSWNERYIFQLAEILIFQGDTNLALTREVSSSSRSFGYDSSRDKRYLVDGFMPYIMDAAIGAQSRAFLTNDLPADLTPKLTIDLGEIYPLEQIHLHRLELGNNIPLSKAFDHGTPKRLLVEGATRADFSDRSLLLDLTLKNSYETGPIIMRNLKGAPCRFVRLSAIEPFIDTLMPKPMLVFGLAEIELFSNQTNVAFQKIPTANFESNKPMRSLPSLTDGHNFYGQILPIREWLEQLTERYELEAERPLVRAELDQRYTQQTVMLRRMGWLAILLTAGIVVIVLVDRIIRLRQIAQIRERFAADLHDDLGASLHTIGLLGDVALASTQSPDRLQTALTRSRDLTKRMSSTIRHATDLQSIGRLESLEKDMQRISERILVGIEYEISTTGSDPLNKLKPRLKMDLFLFVKECLTNIVKHSHADQVKIEVIAKRQSIEVIIHDNGRGLSHSGEKQIPPSLQRRARVMKASISINESAEFTTVIHLTRKRHPLTFWK